MTQYAAFRTDKSRQNYIWKELQAGRLRQGWGWTAEQDLRKIKQKRDAGEALSNSEKAAWRNRRMLAEVWDGLGLGDVLLCPNLPNQSQWVLARIVGAYDFDEGVGGDCRHVLPVEPIRGKDGEIAIIHPSYARVDARLRGSMRAMCRMWSLNHLSDAVERLIQAIESGADLSTGQTKDERREGFLASVHAELTELTWSRLHATYRGAEFEHLLVPLLESVYGEGSVRAIGGAGEKGADLLVTTKGPLGLKFKTAIQVKMYDGTHDDRHPLDQLRWAREEHGVQAGVILTTAVDTSGEFQDELVKLGEELKIDICVWTRDDFVRLLLRHLGGAVGPARAPR